jgi:hypothetical protein
MNLELVSILHATNQIEETKVYSKKVKVVLVLDKLSTMQ